MGHGPERNARRAAATAWSMSSRDPAGTEAMTSSVTGETISMRPSVAGATHSPPMKKVL